MIASRSLSAAITTLIGMCFFFFLLETNHFQSPAQLRARDRKQLVGFILLFFFFFRQGRDKSGVFAQTFFLAGLAFLVGGIRCPPRAIFPYWTGYFSFPSWRKCFWPHVEALLARAKQQSCTSVVRVSLNFPARRVYDMWKEVRSM